jgi:hypothetical protein
MEVFVFARAYSPVAIQGPLRLCNSTPAEGAGEAIQDFSLFPVLSGFGRK